MKKIYISAAFTLMCANFFTPSFAQEAEGACFEPMFETGNIVPDPEMNSISNYPQSWGAATITTATSEVYCGTSSGKITGSSAGSITFVSTWKPNTRYVVRAMVKTNGTFQIGIGNSYINNGNASTDFEIASTANKWTLFEVRFTTGDNATSGECWFNNYGKGGTLGYIDNWEIYEDSNIAVSHESLSFDGETFRTAEFTVTATQLKEDIVIDAPEGLTVTPGVISANARNQKVTVEFDGETELKDVISIVSGETSAQIKVASVVESCYAASLPYTNLVADPEFKDSGKLTLTGKAGLMWIANSTVPYCGVSCAFFGNGSQTASGSLSVNNIAWKPNTVYKVIFKAKNYGNYNVGMTNVDGNSTSRSYLLTGEGTQWYDVDLTIVTGASATSGELVFNNSGSSTAKAVYIDNLEIYEIPDDICE